jgi:transcriptional regulator with XRE-family HTH domain
MRQNALARTLGVRPQMVTKWLKGPETPSAEKLFEMADALAVSLDRLIGRMAPGVRTLQRLEKLDISAAVRSLLPDKGVLEVEGTQPASVTKRKEGASPKVLNKRWKPKATAGARKKR